MTAPRKRNARQAPGGFDETEKQASSHNTPAPTAPQAFAVIVTKASGVRVVFAVHEQERDADGLVKRLRQIGIDASLVPTHAKLTPGMTVADVLAAGAARTSGGRS